jgi:ADP-ribosyl-[dinitrogen reductase] hydrolase
MDANKIKGMLMGLALGDALGAPHEFKYQNNIYTGELVYVVKLWNRFHGESVIGLAAVTDDTEMTFTLIRQILKDDGYIRNNIIRAYEDWATTSKMLGKNTRALFKGIKTVKGYEGRYEKMFSTPQNEWTQSNGSLMRCSPLVIFNNYDNIITDCKLTNPHPNNIEVELIYLYILKLLLVTGTLPKIDDLYKYTKSDDIKSVLDDVKNKVERDIAPKEVRGWAITAFYCALYSIYNIENINDAYKYFILKKGDTDTNAAILGALYGAKLGYTNLEQLCGENVSILLKNNIILRDIDDTSVKLFELYERERKNTPL